MRSISRIPFFRSIEQLFIHDKAIGPQFGARAKVKDRSHLTIFPVPLGKKVTWNGYDASAIQCPRVMKYGGAYFIPCIIFGEPATSGGFRIAVLKTTDDGFTWTQPVLGPIVHDANLSTGQNWAAYTIGVAQTDTQFWVSYIEPQGDGFNSKTFCWVYDIVAVTWAQYGDTAAYSTQRTTDRNFLNFVAPGTAISIYHTDGYVNQHAVSNLILDFGASGPGNLHPPQDGTPPCPYTTFNPDDGWARSCVSDSYGSVHVFNQPYSGIGGMRYLRYPIHNWAPFQSLPVYHQTDMYAVGWGSEITATQEIIFPYFTLAGDLKVLRGDISTAATDDGNSAWVPTFTNELISNSPWNGNNLDISDSGIAPVSDIRPLVGVSPDGLKIRVYAAANSNIPLAMPRSVPSVYVYHTLYWEQVIGTGIWNGPFILGTWDRNQAIAYDSRLPGRYPDVSGPFIAVGDFIDGTQRSAIGSFGGIWYWLTQPQTKRYTFSSIIGKLGRVVRSRSARG